MPDLLPTSSIRMDGGTQPRSILNLNWVKEYGQDMIAGAVFPPIAVFYDGKEYWLADGFHRTEAALALNLAEIAADVRQGTQRDAVLYSVGANGSHGQRRTNQDKRRAVQKMLADPEWSSWSDSEIARRCAVDHKVVSRLRPAPVDTWAKPKSEERTFNHPKTGGPTTMRTGAIGRSANASADQVVLASQAQPTPGGAKGKASASRQPKAEHKRKSAECAREGVPDSTVAKSGLHDTTAAHPTLSSVGNSSGDDEPEFDRAAADLHRDIMIAVAMFATVQATPRQAMDASNKHSGRGVLPESVERAAVWLREFADLYVREEPIRAKVIREILGVAA